MLSEKYKFSIFILKLNELDIDIFVLSNANLEFNRMMNNYFS